MALPALPFVTGIVVGGLTTFLCMDKGSKNKIRSGAAAAAESVSKGAMKVKEAVEPKDEAEEPEAAEEAADMVEDAAEKTEDKVEKS